jgi:CheY-like chemotaxis protein
VCSVRRACHTDTSIRIGRLCKAHAGLTISSISECKPHVSIWLYLPLLVGPNGVQSAIDLQGYVGGRSGTSFLSNRNLVFVVDDDPAVLRAVKRLLRRHGYDSVLFPSAEALENHSDFEGAICIILDIDLTDGSGIELRYRLKAVGISVPVIYMTGSDKPAVRMAALQSGCLAYLEKPFSAKSLIEPLERASTGLT